MTISLYKLQLYLLILTTAYTYNVDIPDKIIIVGDSNVLKMVKIFYIEVIIKFKVPNFSVIVWNKSSYRIYKENDIPVEYSPIFLEDTTAVFDHHKEQYLVKIKNRDEIILHYLEHNLTILHMDSDLYFYKNPLELLKYINENDDIVYQCNNPPLCSELCYGLLYIKPSKPSIELFKRTVKMGKIAANILEFSGQRLMNLLLKYNRTVNLKHFYFPDNVFPHGNNYFKGFGRFVDDPNTHNVVGFHNTYTRGLIAKIYRLKELCLWKDDKDEYYSSKLRRYIKYSSVIHSDNLNIYEIAMINIMHLGKELNRTIILQILSYSKW